MINKDRCKCCNKIFGNEWGWKIYIGHKVEDLCDECFDWAYSILYGTK